MAFLFYKLFSRSPKMSFFQNLQYIDYFSVTKMANSCFSLKWNAKMQSFVHFWSLDFWKFEKFESLNKLKIAQNLGLAGRDFWPNSQKQLNIGYYRLFLDFHSILKISKISWPLFKIWKSISIVENRFKIENCKKCQKLQFFQALPKIAILLK